MTNKKEEENSPKVKVVGVIAEKSLSAAMRKGYLTAGSGDADIIQINIDCFPPEKTTGYSVKLAKQCIFGKPVIVSVRNIEAVHPELRKNHGYKNNGHDLDRIWLLRAGAEVDVDFIELEDNFRRNIFFNPDKTKLIIKHCDFQRTPTYDGLRRICDGIIKRGADVINIETQVREPKDNDSLYKLMAEYSQIKPIVAVGLGEIGRNTWFEGHRFGAYFAYGHTNSTWQVMTRGVPAPGMPDLKTLRAILRTN